MKRTQAMNFFAQSKAADDMLYKKMMKAMDYRSEFPDKIIIIGSDITLSDHGHFEAWNKSRNS
jgi:hypothetical protein